MATTTNEGQGVDKGLVISELQQNNGQILLSIEDIDSLAISLLNQMKGLNITTCERILERIKDFLPRYSYVQALSTM